MQFNENQEGELERKLFVLPKRGKKFDQLWTYKNNVNELVNFPSKTIETYHYDGSKDRNSMEIRRTVGLYANIRLIEPDANGEKYRANIKIGSFVHEWKYGFGNHTENIIVSPYLVDCGRDDFRICSLEKHNNKHYFGFDINTKDFIAETILAKNLSNINFYRDRTFREKNLIDKGSSKPEYVYNMIKKMRKSINDIITLETFCDISHFDDTTRTFNGRIFNSINRKRKILHNKTIQKNKVNNEIYKEIYKETKRILEYWQKSRYKSKKINLENDFNQKEMKNQTKKFVKNNIWDYNEPQKFLPKDSNEKIIEMDSRVKIYFEVPKSILKYYKKNNPVDETGEGRQRRFNISRIIKKSFF